MDKQAYFRRERNSFHFVPLGLVPNMNINMLEGEPGSSPICNIRGFTSINGGQPFILNQTVKSVLLKEYEENAVRQEARIDLSGNNRASTSFTFVVAKQAQQGK